jgi:SAM-dependent methyltransferase
MSAMAKNRKFAKELAYLYHLQNRPLEWFEDLYQSGKEDMSLIPWADLNPNPNLIEWFKELENIKKIARSKECLVVGCGLGNDAEYLSDCGFVVDAFDISQTAIELCKEKFPNSKVNYFSDDLTKPLLSKQYDFVFEAYTLQVLPADLRKTAMANLGKFVRPKGQLLLICRARDKKEDKGDMPWPLTKQEINKFRFDFHLLKFEDYFDEYEAPPVRRFRVLFEKLTKRRRLVLNLLKIK